LEGSSLLLQTQIYCRKAHHSALVDKSIVRLSTLLFQDYKQKLFLLHFFSPF
jgi:hypothetical protein